MKYTIELDKSALDCVVNALCLRPYGEVAALMNFIGAQVTQQEKRVDSAPNFESVPASVRRVGRPRKPKANGAEPPAPPIAN